MAQPEMDHRDAASQKALSADEDQPSAPAVPANESVARGNQFRRWSRRQIAFSAALWLVGVIFLIALSLAAQRYAEFPGDVGLAIWIQQLHQPILMHIVNFASDANWPYPAGAIAISVIVLLLLRRRVLDAFCVALAGFGADLLNVTLNSWVARPRPNNVQIRAVAHLGLHSFPSGHVTHVIAFYGFLLYLSFIIGRQHPRWRSWLLPVQLICGYFILFIGPSRVLEGEHWPSDVLAGYLLGGLVLFAVIALYHVLERGWQTYGRGARIVLPWHLPC